LTDEPAKPADAKVETEETVTVEITEKAAEVEISAETKTKTDVEHKTLISDDGKVDKALFKQQMMNEYNMSDNEAESVWTKWDTNGDGKIDSNEYAKLTGDMRTAMDKAKERHHNAAKGSACCLCCLFWGWYIAALFCFCTLGLSVIIYCYCCGGNALNQMGNVGENMLEAELTQYETGKKRALEGPQL